VKLRNKQLNVRLSDEEAATLSLYALRHGVGPSELVRRMIQQLDHPEPRRRLGRLHLDILQAMAGARTQAMSVLDLVNTINVAGTQIAVALAELEQVGCLSRASLPGRNYLITPAGLERIEER
jgi:hypothetical protein